MWRLKFLIPIIILLTGCQKANLTPVSSASQTCPKKPSQPLGIQNVNKVLIEGKDTPISGMVDEDKQLGYKFDAKSGQLLKYKTDDNVCIWIYAPDSSLLTDGKISRDGSYVLQVSALKGATTFNLIANLADALPQVSTQTKPKVIEDIPPANDGDNESRDPEKFIRQHYAKLNERNYKYTWTDLSLTFKENIGSFSDYTQWWDSVDKINLGSVRIVSKDNGRAIVDADLLYQMKNGDKARDEKGRIYLTWNAEEKHWDIESKAAP